MGNLGGGDHHNAPVVHIGAGYRVFQVAVLHGGVGVIALGMNQPFLFYRRVEIAQFVTAVADHVVFKALVQLIRVRAHGRFSVQDRLVRVVFHLDRAQRARAGYLVLGHHGGDIVAVIAHAAVQQPPVRDVLMLGVGGPGMARRGKIAFRHVKTGYHPHHARYGAGL